MFIVEHVYLAHYWYELYFELLNRLWCRLNMLIFSLSISLPDAESSSRSRARPTGVSALLSHVYQ